MASSYDFTISNDSISRLVCSHHASYSLLLKHTKLLGFHAFFHTIPSSIECFLFLQDPDDLQVIYKSTPYQSGLALWLIPL